MAFNNQPISMVMYKHVSGVWMVDDVRVVRQGLEEFSVDTTRNPEPLDNKAVPRGRPFSCGSCSPGGTGLTTALLCFGSSHIATWHNSDSMAFDDGARSFRIWMKVKGAKDDSLVVKLSCREMPHSRPQPQPALRAFAHEVLAFAIHAYHFLKERFSGSTVKARPEF